MTATGEGPETGERFGMTDLEEALQGEDGADVRRAALDRLDAMGARLARRIAQGTTAAEFGRLDVLANAISAAQHVLLRTGPR
ncbi:EscE/YscE/SsaE family type III secretion system needle protein co-chaperone [uncultured Methylobacterium sp.]|jgi:hypothetical protein|uniref:EscE/YscE/SsaE family type III secretion system needle protein co-chaperone n=1 Tax=uncultured Methylobacterium sp. TaxID=157278 RepID=UPI00260F16BA|nr:EscE/YscE/SsaE family type III secretion system needle protein co-chaperone [uncultured Methylobacterium sp.]